MRMMARCCLGVALGLTLLVAATLPAAAKSPRCIRSSAPTTTSGTRRTSPAGRYAPISSRRSCLPAALVNSQSPRTAARDITNARKAGINFFAIDWWPNDPGYSGEDYQKADDAMQSFLKAPNISQMRFAMFYETWNLGFDPGHESTPVTFQMELHFDADMVSFAKDYFRNRSYLRIDGRPVVFLYLTRTLTGDVAGMIQGRADRAEEAGLRPVSSSGTRSTGASPPRTPTRPARSSRPRHRSTALSSSTPLRPTSSITGIPIGCSVRRRTSRAIRARRTSSPTSVIC